MPDLAVLLQRLLVAVIERGSVVLPLLVVVLLAATAWLVRRRTARFRRLRTLGVVACCVALLLCGVAFGFQSHFHRVIGERAAALDLELLADGSRRTLRDYAGRVVVLNFWATWCPPCVEEMPTLDRLAEAYRDRGLAVLTATDQERALVEEWIEARPLATEVALFTDGAAAPSDSLAEFAFQARPVTLILGRDGRVEALRLGAQGYDELAAAVEPLL